MKRMKRAYVLVLVVIIPTVFFDTAFAKIDFGSMAQIKIDLEKLTITKEQFFSFLVGEIKIKPFGLGNYGRVPFSPCDFKINNRRLIRYRTQKGIENRFLSNPSCNQTVVRRVLENSYDYQSKNLSTYMNRRCILTIEKIFSPMLEYYTILYEEKSSKNCRHCDIKEQERLSQIINLQQKIKRNCDAEQEKVVRFLNDLDGMIESAYQQKNRK